MTRYRIAVATQGNKGLEDVVSNVFGRAKTFTIVDVEDEKISRVKVLENPALSYPHGAGPIAIKTLIDDGVKVVIAAELGVGASEILQKNNINHIQVKPGNNVQKTVKSMLVNNKIRRL